MQFRSFYKGFHIRLSGFCGIQFFLSIFNSLCFCRDIVFGIINCCFCIVIRLQSCFVFWWAFLSIFRSGLIIFFCLVISGRCIFQIFFSISLGGFCVIECIFCITEIFSCFLFTFLCFRKNIIRCFFYFCSFILFCICLIKSCLVICDIFFSYSCSTFDFF